MISFKGSSDLAHFTCRIVSEAKTTSLAIHQSMSKSISLSEMFKILFILGCFMFGGVKSPQKPWGRWMHFVINVCKELWMKAKRNMNPEKSFGALYAVFSWKSSGKQIQVWITECGPLHHYADKWFFSTEWYPVELKMFQ